MLAICRRIVGGEKRAGLICYIHLYLRMRHSIQGMLAPLTAGGILDRQSAENVNVGGMIAFFRFRHKDDGVALLQRLLQKGLLFHSGHQFVFISHIPILVKREINFLIVALIKNGHSLQ